MYVVTVHFTILPDHIESFRQHMKVQAENSLNLEPDCHHFDVCYDPGDDTVCFLYELYTDEAAFQAHLDSDHFLSFNETVTPWIADKAIKTYVTSG